MSQDERSLRHTPYGTLYCSRKKGQGFSIGHEILIFVEKIQGDQAKIKVIAPKDLEVIRLENQGEKAPLSVD